MPGGNPNIKFLYALDCECLPPPPPVGSLQFAVGSLSACPYLHYRITTLSNCQITALPHYRIVELSHYRIVTLSNYRIV